LVDLQDGKEEFEIVGPEETDPLQGKISYESPLGKALLNKSVEEVAEINTPEGKRKYKIIKISC
jgi:transcription elongation factor GreA